MFCHFFFVLFLKELKCVDSFFFVLFSPRAAVNIVRVALFTGILGVFLFLAGDSNFPQLLLLSMTRGIGGRGYWYVSISLVVGGVPILVNSNHLKYIFVFVLRIIHLERNHRHDNVGGKTTKKITQMPFFFVWFSKRSLGMGVRIKSYLGAVISTWYTRAL